MKHLHWLHCALAALGAGALTACTVGPAYQRPATPDAARYTARPLATRIPPAVHAQGAIAAGQRFERGTAVTRDWWTGFASPTLDRLVNQALAHNPTLAAAAATLDEARAQLKAAKGIFYPQVNLGLGAERTRTSSAETGGNFPPESYNLYTGEVNVSYDLDAFGLNRAVVRQRHAQVDVAHDQLAAARLSVAGNVVNTAFDLAALESEVAATRKNVRDEQRVLKLTKTQYRLGAIDQFAVLTQESLLATTRAKLVQLLQARDVAHHLLATLVGELPGNSAGLVTPSLTALRLPTALPLSLPTTLVRRRPDIRAAEAQLRGANAEVAEAVARLYPDVQLTADFGFQSNLTRLFFHPASEIWAAAASLAAPLFEGGTLRAQERAAKAAYQTVFANYRSTVLAAFQNVADVLRALQHDSALLNSRAQALNASRGALDLVTTEYRAGGVDFLQVLTDETQFQNARIAYVEAEAQRYADTAALYVALGGGQWSIGDSAISYEQAPAPPWNFEDARPVGHGAQAQLAFTQGESHG